MTQFSCGLGGLVLSSCLPSPSKNKAFLRGSGHPRLPTSLRLYHSRNHFQTKQSSSRAQRFRKFCWVSSIGSLNRECLAKPPRSPPEFSVPVSHAWQSRAGGTLLESAELSRPPHVYTRGKQAYKKKAEVSGPHRRCLPELSGNGC